MPEQSLKTLLGRRDSALGDLKNAAEAAVSLKPEVIAGLAPELRHGVIATALDDAGTLHLTAPSPAWAARLRYAAPDLLDYLRARGIHVTAVTAHVAPQGSN
ncbi:MAG: DciA family protein [Pseudomonadota bacterium]